jgi:hypothetical protein
VSSGMPQSHLKRRNKQEDEGLQVKRQRLWCDVKQTDINRYEAEDDMRRAGPGTNHLISHRERNLLPPWRNAGSTVEATHSRCQPANLVCFFNPMGRRRSGTSHLGRAVRLVFGLGDDSPIADQCQAHIAVWFQCLLPASPRLTYRMYNLSVVPGIECVYPVGWNVLSEPLHSPSRMISANAFFSSEH